MSARKPEIGTAIVLMTGKNTGTIQNESSRGIWKKGDSITSTKLAGYAPNLQIAAVIRLSDTGRRMVLKTSIHSSVPNNVATKKAANTVLKAAGELIKTIEERGEFVELNKNRTTPSLDGYYISPEVRMNFSTAKRLMDKRPERAVKVMMVGDSGNGKTTMPRLLAERLGMEFMRMDCGKIRDSEEWFGYREAREGSTVFVRSRFMNALTKGNMVIVLDEFNRLEPWLHNTLFPLLDEDGRTVVHDEEFVIGSNVLVVATINNGSQYTGTFELDKALLNRFEFVVEVNGIPHIEEVRVLMKRTGIARVEAERIVKTANILRQMGVACSIRSTLNIANFVMAGLTVRQAFETAVALRLPPDVNGSMARKNVVDRLNVELGVMALSISWDVFKDDEPEQKIEEDFSKENAEVAAKYKLELHRRGQDGFGKITFISLLTGMVYIGDDGKVRGMTQRVAQEYANKIENNIPVTIFLDRTPPDLKNLVKRFNDCGVGGLFRVLTSGEGVSA